MPPPKSHHSNSLGATAQAELAFSDRLGGPFPSLLKILWLQADKSSNKDKYYWLENPYCLLYVPLGNLSMVT